MESAPQCPKIALNSKELPPGTQLMTLQQQKGRKEQKTTIIFKGNKYKKKNSDNKIKYYSDKC